MRSRCARSGQDHIYCCVLSSKQVVCLAVNGDIFLFASVFENLRLPRFMHNARSESSTTWGVYSRETLRLRLAIAVPMVLALVMMACKQVTSILETLDGWLAQGGGLKAIKEHHSLVLSIPVQEHNSKRIRDQLTRSALRKRPAHCPAPRPPT